MPGRNRTPEEISAVIRNTPRSRSAGKTERQVRLDMRLSGRDRKGYVPTRQDGGR